MQISSALSAALDLRRYSLRARPGCPRPPRAEKAAAKAAVKRCIENDLAQGLLTAEDAAALLHTYAR